MGEPVVNIGVRQYVEREITHLDEKFKLLYEKSCSDLKKTEEEIERRLVVMNRFREQLDKQSKDFITRQEYEIKHELIIQKLDTALRLVYIGLGIVLALELIFKFLIK